MYPRRFPDPNNQIIQKIEDPFQLPLLEVLYKIKVVNSLVKSELHLTYLNESDKSQEITLETPTNYDLVISKLKIKIGDNEIEAQIQDKEKAREKYEDAIASGNQAGLMLYKDDQEDVLQLNLGNVLPNQMIQVEIETLEMTKAFEGAYQLNIPKSMIFLLTENRDTSKLIVEIATSSKITELFCQKTLQISHDQQNEDSSHVLIELDKGVEIAEQDIDIYYRTNDSDKPKALYQVNQDRVALMFQLLPSFLPEPQESDIQIYRDELPQDMDVDPRLLKKFLVVFLVDRSGSMSGEKMKITNQALVLFLKSLPTNSTLFQIISFGTRYDTIKQENDEDKKIDCTPYEYNQENLDFACAKVEQFSANKGGTNIFDPLKAAFEIQIPDGYSKQIFLLTDGQIQDSQKCFEQIKQKLGKLTQIHTFGIGNDCDTRLVSQIAMLGDGQCTILKNQEIPQLRQKVVATLATSISPKFKNIKSDLIIQYPILINSSNLPANDTTIARSQLFAQFYVLDQKSFDESDQDLAFELSFDDPQNSQQTKIVLFKKDFKNLEEDGSQIEKLAAHFHLKQLDRNNLFKDIVQVSIDYQVLSQQTAMIAVHKNQDKDMQSSEMEKQLIDLVNRENQDRLRILRSYDYSQYLQLNMVIAPQAYAQTSAFAYQGNSFDSLSKTKCKKRSINQRDISRSNSRDRDRNRNSGSHMLSYSQTNQRGGLGGAIRGGRGGFAGAISGGRGGFAGAISGGRGRGRPRRNTGGGAINLDFMCQDYEEDEDLSYDQHLENHQFKRNKVKGSSNEEIKDEFQTKNKEQTINKDRDSILQQIYKDQTIDGRWREEKIVFQMMNKFDTNKFKVEVLKIIENQNNGQNVNVDLIWVTIAILLILAHSYSSSQQEWQLIAKKGKTFIKNNGVKNPDQLIKELLLVCSFEN
ncbi:UNKNOWN [Stylonychia lemnae]|uniref:Uncharacterized protein n=1 Tax=Stylonychia lemnae TaxID=5949 RepID=A0A078A2P3_STYLE|nr:UNKNOWN [Stylonychia lemnae]|eukprot:CDW76097.1 UNKNOWN [Stylonychia lemnae]